MKWTLCKMTFMTSSIWLSLSVHEIRQENDKQLTASNFCGGESHLVYMSNQEPNSKSSSWLVSQLYFYNWGLRQTRLHLFVSKQPSIHPQLWASAAKESLWRKLKVPSMPWAAQCQQTQTVWKEDGLLMEQDCAATPGKDEKDGSTYKMRGLSQGQYKGSILLYCKTSSHWTPSPPSLPFPEKKIHILSCNHHNWNDANLTYSLGIIWVFLILSSSSFVLSARAEKKEY